MQEILVQKEPGTYDFWTFHVYPHMKMKMQEKSGFWLQFLNFSIFRIKTSFFHCSSDFCLSAYAYTRRQP